MRAFSYACSLPVTDKDGGYTIRSAVPENPMLHANITAVCFIERELLPIQVLHCGNRNFGPFGSCDLDLDPMTFTYELDPCSLEMYRMCESELPTSTLSKVIVWQTERQTDRQTDIQTGPKLGLYTTPLRGWSIKLKWKYLSMFTIVLFHLGLLFTERFQCGRYGQK